MEMAGRYSSSSPPQSGRGRVMKVLVSDAIDQAGLDILKGVAQVDVKLKLSEEELCNMIPEYDALMVRSGTQVTEKVIRSGKNLKIVGRAGVGVDNVDVKTATALGIFVVNSPLGNTIAAAEHTLTLMMALSRHIAPADASLRQNKWDRSKFMGTQLHGKILAIVGLGQVGAHVAKVAGELGMKIVAYDPYVNAAKAESLRCETMELDELWETADYVTLHVPLIESTKHLINADTIKKMKKTCRIINASRGGVVDETALVTALKEQRLAGAALDVFEVEKAFAPDHPLLGCPNLLLTPHLGASTAEAQVNVAVDVAHQIKDCLAGRLPESAVNIPGLRASELHDLMPLIRCCDTVGRFAAQLLKTALTKVSVTTYGSYCDVKGEVVLLAATKGAMSARFACPVNFVNVRHMAESNKVILTMAKESAANQQPSVAVKVTGSNDESITVRGTASEKGETLIVESEGVPLYMIVPRSMSLQHFLYTTHDDTPGVLGHITSKLGERGINIGDMHLGRKGELGFGVCIALIDRLPEKEALEVILQSQKVKTCEFFSL